MSQPTSSQQVVVRTTLPDAQSQIAADLIEQALIYAGYYVRMETAVRPWVEITSLPVPREPKAPNIVRPEAFIEWGGPSDFKFDTFRSDAKNIGFNTDDDDDKPKRVRYTFSEEGRNWKDVRVENPDDPDQFIIARDATRLALNGPNGEQFVAVLHPTAPGTQTGSGQTPPAPPPLDKIGEIEEEEEP